MDSKKPAKPVAAPVTPATASTSNAKLAATAAALNKGSMSINEARQAATRIR